MKACEQHVQVLILEEEIFFDHPPWRMTKEGSDGASEVTRSCMTVTRVSTTSDYPGR